MHCNSSSREGDIILQGLKNYPPKNQWWTKVGRLRMLCPVVQLLVGWVNREIGLLEEMCDKN